MFASRAFSIIKVEMPSNSSSLEEECLVKRFDRFIVYIGNINIYKPNGRSICNEKQHQSSVSIASLQLISVSGKVGRSQSG